MQVCIKCNEKPNTGEGALCQECYIKAKAIYDQYHIVKSRNPTKEEILRELLGRIHFEVAIAVLDDVHNWRINPNRVPGHQQRIDILLKKLEKVHEQPVEESILAQAKDIGLI